MSDIWYSSSSDSFNIFTSLSDKELDTGRNGISITRSNVPSVTPDKVSVTPDIAASACPFSPINSGAFWSSMYCAY